MLKLVYGCLAFSAVALVILFASAAGDGPPFRGMTKSMGDAVAQGATVLAADSTGAVTQTGNGRIAGYRRGSDKRVWKTTFARFQEGPSNPYGAGAIDATASCAGECPSAIVELLGRFSAQGDASPVLAETLTELDQGSEGVLEVTGEDTAFVRARLTDAVDPNLLWADAAKVTGAPVSNPSAVEVDAQARRAVVGAAKGSRGTLSQILLKGSRWQAAAKSLPEAGLKNACISADGEWVGSVGARIHRFAFGASSDPVVGPPVASGTCTVDASGITVAYTTADDPSLQIMRIAASGRRLWNHHLGAQRLLSGGGSPHLVAQAGDNTVSVFDAITGRTLLTRAVAGSPYVGRDGSVVIADREGKPDWLVAGKSVD